MKKLILLSFLLTCGYSSAGQTINKTDSLEVMVAVKRVFQNFEKPNYSAFYKIATEEIWCLLCDSGTPPETAKQRINSDVFFRKHLKRIAATTTWQRASKLNDITLHRESNSQADITVFITVWEEGEYTPENEGLKLGLRFRKEKGNYLLSGLETVP